MSGLSKTAEMLEKAVAAHRAGDLAQAEPLYRAVIAEAPDEASALNNLALIVQGRGATPEAEALLARALAAAPGFAEAHYNLGVIRQARGEAASALDAYRRVVELAPDHLGALINGGNAAAASGDLGEAADWLRRAIAVAPDHAEARYNLGGVLLRRGALRAAEAELSQALSLKPDLAFAWVALGDAHRGLGEDDRALAAYERAKALSPSLPQAWFNHGSLLLERGRAAEAVPLLRFAVAQAPNDLMARLHLGLAEQAIAEWSGHRDLTEATAALARMPAGAPNPVTPWRALTLPAPAGVLRQLAERESAAVLKRIEHLPRPERRPRTPSERLHIGYLGIDAPGLPNAEEIAALIGAHDRNSVRVTAYTITQDEGPAPIRRLQEGAAGHAALAGCDAAEAAARIAADGIDVLLDLRGHTLPNRLDVLALEPAAAQAHYLGYPGTIGAPFLPYLIVDDSVAPADAAGDFTETLVVLPQSYLLHGGRGEQPSTTRAAQGLPESGFVFCCFNAVSRIDPGCFDVWMRLLAQMPESVLWLLGEPPEAIANLRAEAGRRGIDPDRLIFAPRLPRGAHRARMAMADLFLDTFVCGGHSTAADALAAGLPFLTCRGATFQSRVASGLLRTLGLDELVTESAEAYAATALTLARERGRLAELRARLDRSRARSGFFDIQRKAALLESACRLIAEDKKRGGGSAPRRLIVPPLPA